MTRPRSPWSEKQLWRSFYKCFEFLQQFGRKKQWKTPSYATAYHSTAWKGNLCDLRPYQSPSNAQEQHQLCFKQTASNTRRSITFNSLQASGNSIKSKIEFIDSYWFPQFCGAAVMTVHHFRTRWRWQVGWRYGRLWQCDLKDTERCHDSGVFQLLVH